MQKNLNHFHISWIKKEFIYGAHLTSFSATAIILSVNILLDLPINFLSLFIAYLITLLVYSYNYQSEADEDSSTNTEKSEFLRNRKKKYPYIFVINTSLIILLLLLLDNIYFIIFIFIILSGGLLYTIVFKTLTMTIPGFKSIYVSIILTYFGVFYSILLYSQQIDIMLIFLTWFIFLKLLINIVFFDLKDVESDISRKLKTFPILLGKSKTLFYLNLINFVTLATLAYCVYCGIFPIYSIVLAPFFIYTAYYLYKGKIVDQSNLLYYTYIMADAEFIFWPALLYISKFIFLNIV